MVASKSSATTIEEGDYVIIQFAHNDEKNEGADGDTVKAYYNYIGDATTAASTDYRGTTPYGTFKGFIRNFINETKARGGKPIIVTPICRKYFSGNTIRRNGMHDLGDKFTICDGQSYKTDNSVPASDNTYDYAQSLIDVAAEYKDVPVIDLTQLTAELYLSYGEQYCTENLFCSSDNTHTIALGATLIARTFAQAVKNGENMITKVTYTATMQLDAEKATDFTDGPTVTVTPADNVASATATRNGDGGLTITVVSNQIVQQEALPVRPVTVQACDTNTSGHPKLANVADDGTEFVVDPADPNRNILVGDATDGGCFATVGASDAVFVLPESAVYDLSADIVEE
jgi:hypothetical protein